MKKILVLFLCVLTMFTCFGCKGQKEEKATYMIKITDVDAEELGEKEIEVDKYENLCAALEKEFDSTISVSEYGAYLIRINGSVIDSNWSLMVYVNGTLSNQSADKIIPQENDEIEVKNVCWAAIDYGFGVTYDRVDVMIDRSIYHYIKRCMKPTLESTTTFKGSTMWEMMFLSIYKEWILDNNLTDDIKFTEELKNEIKNTDITTLTGADIGKYYYHAKVLGLLPENFKEVYEGKLEELAGTTFNGYLTPFIIGPAYSLGADTSVIKSICSKVDGTLSYGPIGNIWQAVSENLYVDVTADINMADYAIDWTKVYDWGSNTDMCSVIMLACALGINIRDYKINLNGEDLDFIDYIFTQYYDLINNILKEHSTDTDYIMSSNQIYLSLLAYKIFREHGKCNVFGLE